MNCLKTFFPGVTGITAIEDRDMSPAQRKHWQQMEEKQAEKERATAAQAELRKQQQAKALQEAADAMDKVRFDHSHKLGRMA